MVSVYIKHHERRSIIELSSCVNREVGPGSHSLSHSSPVPLMISHIVFVEVKRHKRKKYDNCTGMTAKE